MIKLFRKFNTKIIPGAATQEVEKYKFKTIDTHPKHLQHMKSEDLLKPT